MSEAPARAPYAKQTQSIPPTGAAFGEEAGTGRLHHATISSQATNRGTLTADFLLLRSRAGGALDGPAGLERVLG
jgi:hypothetical protein